MPPRGFSSASRRLLVGFSSASHHRAVTKMANTQPSHSEQQSLDVVRDRIRAWWASVLVGQTREPHPVHGDAVRAHMDGDTLVITGKAASRQDRRAIAREAEHLRDHGVAHMRNELAVVPETTDRRGLLVQTLIGFFATPDQAGFAAGYLEGHALIPSHLLTLIDRDPADADAGLEQLRAVIPQAYWHEGETALDAGQTLLVLVVDELDAFKARELLEEETPSLRLLVLPPEPAHAPDRAEHALRRSSQAGDRAHKATDKATGKPSRATHVRQRTRAREAASHDT
jgi:hypothetical protein